MLAEFVGVACVAAADDAACSAGGVPSEWRALSKHELNTGQECTLAAIASGGNVLSRQPTGSGKSYAYLLPALARWAAVAGISGLTGHKYRRAVVFAKGGTGLFGNH